MRTAPMGPSKGMPESIRAAEAPLMAGTSWGFTRSAARVVPTTWTSLRNPSGKHGRSGRSIRRQVRMAWSGALPSRRKNEPGILPAAYMRSSMSTVRGKKSAPSRAELAAVAVTRTTVSPRRTVTAPPAWPASLPVSKVRVFSGAPVTTRVTEWGSVMGCLLWDRSVPSCRGLTAPVPSGEGRRRSRHGGLRPSPLAADVRVRPVRCANGDREVAVRGGVRLAPQTQLGDDRPVALDVVLLDVVEQPATTTHQHQEPSPAVMVLLVDLQVLGEVVDAVGEQCDLHLGRTGVGLVQSMLSDGSGLGRQVGGILGHTVPWSGFRTRLRWPAARSSSGIAWRNLKRMVV